MDNFGNEMFRTKNFLRLDHLFDLFLRQTFQYMTFFFSHLKRIYNRILLSRPTARHDRSRSHFSITIRIGIATIADGLESIASKK